MPEFKNFDAEYKEKQRLRGKGGGNYYANQVSYVGRRFLGLVMQALAQNYVTSVEAKRMLGIDPNAI
jgi:hypothetical protein